MCRKQKKYFSGLLFAGLLLASGKIYAESDFEKAESFLEEFYKDPKENINQSPIRDYSQATHIDEKEWDTFRQIVRKQRQQAIENESLQSPRDLILKHSGKTAEKNTKRTWLDIDAPESILGNTYLKDVSALPTFGQAVDEKKRPVGWSNDYWPIAYGSLSMRYAHARSYPSYREAFNLYQQPQDYFGLIKNNNLPTSLQTDTWSPAEKYDLLVGDRQFTLTNKLKNEGFTYAKYDEKSLEKDRDGNITQIIALKEDVALWMGKCHGWAAAATTVPRITQQITLTGANGDIIHFHADDIRGLVTLKWAQSPYRTLTMGGRCNKSLKKGEIKIDADTGAIYDDECFDVNPGAFRIALGNYIGLRKKGMVMDATFDDEVWNHPIQKYQVLGYFNPDTRQIIKVKKTGVASAGRIPSKAIAPYGFKKDPFSKLREEKWKDAHQHERQWIKYKREHEGKEFRPSSIVGEIISVTYLVETKPKHGESYPDQFVTVTYVYDLELNDSGNIVGGEWYSNKHPDFLWAVDEYSAQTGPMNGIDDFIQETVKNLKLTHYNGTPKSLANINLVKVRGEKTLAQYSSSMEAAPLATVINYLVEQTKE